jgi:hypothetical protein
MLKKLTLKKIVGLSLVLTICLSLLVLPLTGNAASIGTRVSLASTLPVVINPDTVFEQPPANFNPLTATPEELQKYGFPAKPTNVKDAVNWEYAMEHAKQYVKPIQEPSLFRYGYLGDYFNGGTAGTLSWAGYVAPSVNNGNELYTETSAYWTQPSYVNNTWAGFWTGLGGANNTTTIVQAGATSDANTYGGSSPYEFWMEDHPNGAIYEAAPVLNAGNEVYVYVEYIGNQQSNVFFENVTTQKYTSVPLTTLYYDGSSVDYVNEETNYSNWGSVNFSNCDYALSNGTNGPFTNLNYYRYISGAPGYTWAIPAYPPTSNGSFTINSILNG